MECRRPRRAKWLVKLEPPGEGTGAPGQELHLIGARLRSRLRNYTKITRACFRGFGSTSRLGAMSDRPIVFPSTLAEVQGLYGAFSFPEKLLQKIWLRGDFDRAAAVTSDGRKLRIVHPGKWNLLGGPDFSAARLRFGDQPEREISGDVEVQLRGAGGNAHGH